MRREPNELENQAPEERPKLTLDQYLMWSKLMFEVYMKDALDRKPGDTK